jgi:hypothetical protein
MKKTTYLLMALLVGLATMGFNCVNDGFVVSVNLPLTLTFNVNNGNAGSNANFSGSATLALKDQIDPSYLGNLHGARSYDLRVSTIGDFSGTVSNGVVRINGQTILTFSGPWNSFHTPQSVLGSSSLVQPNNTGIQVLLNALQQFQTNQNVSVTLDGGGTITTPYPAGLQVQIELLSQVDAQVGGN